MIPIREIRERARTYGVPESTIERYYAQNWILWSLSDVDMAFKGGTCIRKIYIPNYRFSDDLDFTMLRGTEKEDMTEIVAERVLMAREESGIPFLDDITVDENLNGLEIGIYFRILWTGGSPMKIKLDITKHNRERIMMPVRRMKVMHDYPDFLEVDIYAYSLEEIFSEKLRSLFERTRPRDLYDVWMLKEIVDMEEALEILPEKFRYKGISTEIGSLLSRKDAFRMAWKTSLTHQIKNLPDFEEVFREILLFIEGLNMRV